ncbi:MAG TPA: YibE/F family protein [Candidatus Obscuribacterales bacterium]
MRTLSIPALALLVAVFHIWLLPSAAAPDKGKVKQGAPVIERLGDSISTGSAPPNQVAEEFVVGKVHSVSETVVDQSLLEKTGMLSRRQKVVVEIAEGPLKGKLFTLANEITDNPAYNVDVRPGQEVILSLVTADGKTEINIADYHRAPVLLWLCLVFFAVFLGFGGSKGLKSLAGLAVTVALIAFILLPLSLQGYNPLLVSVCICLVAACASMIFVAGFSRKALASIIGTLGGVVIAGLAAQAVIVFAPLTGLSSEEAQILRGSVLFQKPQFYSGLLAAGMLIGALGVIMDVGISIASAATEVAKASARASRKELYDAGMNVGRDIMGTMTNTLVLAYAGGALPLLLLASQMPSVKLINLDLFATEIASALSGSLGLVFTIPLTALACAVLLAAEDGNNRQNDEFAVSFPESVEGKR